MQTLQAQAMSNFLISHPDYSVLFKKAPDSQLIIMKVLNDKGIEVISLFCCTDGMGMGTSEPFYIGIDNGLIGFVNSLATGSLK